MADCDQSEGFNRWWQEYARAFIESDGRLVDSYQQYTHSEGQGTAMLFAAVAQDKATFQRAWEWTQKHLRRPDGLYAWKWQNGRVADLNNASDGDILIAWALLIGYRQWDDPSFRDSALEILDAIKLLLVTPRFGFTLLLPGSLFYDKPDRILTNPSYLILPAFRAFSYYDDAAFWNDFYQQSIHFLKAAQTVQPSKKEPQVVSDWMQVSPEGVTYSTQHDPLLGYDSIRVPLYLAWMGETELLKPYRVLWQQLGGAEHAPSTYDLRSGAHSDYAPEAGLVAVRKLATQERITVQEHDLKKQGYYSASLLLFATLARERFILGYCP